MSWCFPCRHALQNVSNPFTALSRALGGANVVANIPGAWNGYSNDSFSRLIIRCTSACSEPHYAITIKLESCILASRNTSSKPATIQRTFYILLCMQAWGNISNLCILLFFLAVLGQTAAPYDPAKLSLTWRIQYGVGTLIIAGMLYHRCFHLKESAVWEVRSASLFSRFCHDLTLIREVASAL